MKLGSQTIDCGDCIRLLTDCDYPQVDLVIADPPYWKVVGEKWDYLWRTESDYLAWCEKWLALVYKQLRIGGTFYLFGYFRMLAHLVPYLQQLGFSLRQQIIIDKGLHAVAGRATKNYKMFPNTTESILFLVKDNKEFSRNLLKMQQGKLGLSAKHINEALGVKSNGGGMWSIYTGVNICEQFPTRELWHKLEEILQFEYCYDKIAQTFHPQIGLSDVWNDIDFYAEKRYHPTQKPLKLIRRLIETSSNEGDLILDPFAGSGSTAIAAEQLNRRSINIEIDEKYLVDIPQRFAEECHTLFPSMIF